MKIIYFFAVVLTTALAAEVEVPTVPPTSTSTTITQQVASTSTTTAAEVEVPAVPPTSTSTTITQQVASTSTTAAATVQKTATSTTTERAATTVSIETTTLTDQERCHEMIGMFVDDKFQGLEVKYDLAKLLEKYGGPPGKVNATKTEREDAPVDEKDKDKRPLPDADQKYWIYKYGDTDGKTYIRIEHAVHRFSKTPKEFLEVRGQLYFSPEDFCGNARRAEYTLDDRGFTFEVTREYCGIGSVVRCAHPSVCTTYDDGHRTCIAAPSIALLASLIGGGK